MNDLILSFTSQLNDAMEIGQKAKLIQPTKTIQNVVVCGLGGSGIGGNLVAELVADKMHYPMTVVKDYHLPFFVNKHTLLIICSYSGNTEETIHALKEGIDRNAKIVCIASGGSLEHLAETAGLDYIKIPSGMPPRAALAFSFVQQLYILSRFKLIDEGWILGLESAIELIDHQEKKIQKFAQRIAKKIWNKTPVIYAPAGTEAVAVRWRQQINENSKMLCWHHVIPEMNHNELVGWRNKGKYAVIMLRNETDYERTKHRFEIAKGIIGNYTKTIIEVESHGENAIARSLYLIHLGDWVSFFTAEKRGVDAVEVKVIDYLKAELAK